MAVINLGQAVLSGRTGRSFRPWSGARSASRLSGRYSQKRRPYPGGNVVRPRWVAKLTPILRSLQR